MLTRRPSLVLLLALPLLAIRCPNAPTGDGGVLVDDNIPEREICGEVSKYDFVADQSADVGQVVISNDADNLYVKFVIENPATALKVGDLGDWMIGSTYVHVSTEEWDYPGSVKNDCMPEIEGFTYSSIRDVCLDGGVLQVEYAIPISDRPCDPVCIDGDRDGYCEDEDCDDSDPETHLEFLTKTT